MKILIMNTQLALFSPGIDLSDKLSLAQKIKSEAGNLLDGDPIVLPIPNDAPAEIPRIILRNKNEQISLNISNNKIDLFIKTNNSDFEGLFDTGKQTYQNLLKSLYESTALVVNRVGYVVNEELSVKDSNKFIVDGYLGSFSEGKEWQDINLGLLKRDLIDKKNTNIWFRTSPARDVEGDVDLNKLLITFDMNTLPKEAHSFALKDILNYLEVASKYLDKYSQEILK